MKTVILIYIAHHSQILIWLFKILLMTSELQDDLLSYANDQILIINSG